MQVPSLRGVVYRSRCFHDRLTSLITHVHHDTSTHLGPEDERDALLVHLRSLRAG